MDLKLSLLTIVIRSNLLWLNRQPVARNSYILKKKISMSKWPLLTTTFRVCDYYITRDVRPLETQVGVVTNLV